MAIRERSANDAPAGYNLREAETWANGFNAAAEIANELLRTLKALLPHAARGIEADRAATDELPEHLRGFFADADTDARDALATAASILDAVEGRA